MAGKYTQEQWISLAEKKYPGEFDYSKTEYIDSYHKVKIKCKKHNCFFYTGPSRFLTANINSCPECNSNRLTQETFIEKAIEKHPLLDFSKSKYITYLEEVTIICANHGEFKKKPKSILGSQNDICPGCIKEKQEEAINRYEFYKKNKQKGQEPGTFYKLKVTHKPSKISFIKIGITSYTTFKRYNDKRYDDFDFEVLDEIHTTNLESALLEKQYKEKNKENKFYLPKNIWFGGRSELYQFDGYQQLYHSQVKFIRDCLLNKQNGKCPLCFNDVVMPTLDHYHVKRQGGTGLVRGVLCNTCNRMTGVVENNLARNSIDYSDAPQFLRELADYLQDKRERYIHPSEKPKPPTLMKSSYNKLIKIVNGKQKVPKYNGKFTKALERLYEKYELEPEFKKSSA